MKRLINLQLFHFIFIMLREGRGLDYFAFTIKNTKFCKHTCLWAAILYAYVYILRCHYYYIQLSDLKLCRTIFVNINGGYSAVVWMPIRVLSYMFCFFWLLCILCLIRNPIKERSSAQVGMLWMHKSLSYSYTCMCDALLWRHWTWGIFLMSK